MRSFLLNVTRFFMQPIWCGTGVPKSNSSRHGCILSFWGGRSSWREKVHDTQEGAALCPKGLKTHLKKKKGGKTSSAKPFLVVNLTKHDPSFFATESYATYLIHRNRNLMEKKMVGNEWADTLYFKRKLSFGMCHISRTFYIENIKSAWYSD